MVILLKFRIFQKYAGGGGGGRIIYEHPFCKDILIKICRPNGKDELKYHNSFFKRYGIWRYGGMWAWHREYEEYIALLWRTGTVPDFIPKFYGFCQTDLGPGMMVEKIVGADGQVARTLSDIKKSGIVDPRLEGMIRSFFEKLRESGCVATDLRPRNIVIAGDFERLVLVDGPGDILLIKLKMFSRRLLNSYYKKYENMFLQEFSANTDGGT